MPNKIIFIKQQINKIIDLYTSGLSCKEIGKQFNCSKQTINSLIKNNNIEIRDYSHCNRKYDINENIFETIDSQEKAYWLGMITGDGWVTDRLEFGLSLQEKDKEHMYKYKKFLQSSHPMTIINNHPKKDGSPSKSYALTINNKKIVFDLQKYGIKPQKTLNMSFPNLSDEFLSNYLSSYMLGLIDSDGCFCLKSHYKNKKLLNFNFVGTTKFVESFQKLLIDRCNISKTKLGTSKSTNFIRIIEYGGYKNIFKIVKFLYSKSPIWMERKKNIATNYLLTKYPQDKWLMDNISV